MVKAIAGMTAHIGLGCGYKLLNARLIRVCPYMAMAMIMAMAMSLSPRCHEL